MSAAAPFLSLFDTGTVFFAVWLLLASALIGLWVWSRVGAPIFQRFRQRREIAKRSARLPQALRSASALVPFGTPQVAGATLDTIRVAANAEDAVAAKPRAAQRPGLNSRWKPDNRIAA